METNMEILREIQLCQLDILKELDRVCKIYDIKYWLAYGTFLGAVRHQGFIPWDDDLDVHMTMKDFRKFERICKKELKKEYFLQTPNTQSNTKWLFYKIRKNNTLMLESGLTIGANEIHNGIWIDIFPMISCAKTDNKKNKQILLLKKLQNLRYWHSNPNDKERSLKTSIRELIISFYEKILWIKVSMLASNKSIHYLIIENEFYANKTEKHIARATIEKQLFEKSAEYSFEGSLFMGILDYDAYLKQMYGIDYKVPKKFGQHIVDYSKVILK